MKTYEDDILNHLRYQNCIPAAIREAQELAEAIRQAVCRAADEIEKLRKENNHLRKINRKLARRIR